MVEYTVNELLPGKVFFRCERLRASLTTEACAGMWGKADASDGAECGACMRCPLGAKHAGAGEASMSALRGARVCGRCHRGSLRMIGGHLCPSCYNRGREWVIGRNAKGKPPVKLGALDARCVRYNCGGELRRLRMPHTLDSDELVVAVLRDSRQRVAFAYNAAPPPSIRQKSLW